MVLKVPLFTQVSSLYLNKFKNRRVYSVINEIIYYHFGYLKPSRYNLNGSCSEFHTDGYFPLKIKYPIILWHAIVWQVTN